MEWLDHLFEKYPGNGRLGGLAGAQTMTAGLAAVQEKADSTVAVLGYSGTVSFGHILLTTCGTLIIALLS